MPSYHAKVITHMGGGLQTTLLKTLTITIQHVVVYKTYYNGNINMKEVLFNDGILWWVIDM